MSDQANELRKLVLRAMREAHPNAGPAPRLILMIGGQQRVGVTTMAVNLAVALAEQGARIVLIDANSQTPGVATLCGLNPSHPVADMLATRRDIHEAIQPGPAGIQVIPGLQRPGHEPEVSSMALERLMLQISKLGRHADSVLVDVGNEDNELVRRLVRDAEEVILVSTTDIAAVMDTYARIKIGLSGQMPGRLSLLVTRSASEQQAGDVFKRIERSCRRFLGQGIEFLGTVFEGEEVTAAAQAHQPFMVLRPQSAAARAMQSIAVKLAVQGERPDQMRASA
jgi:MinD-like ATPase involved in chromosome partitioning or flagellar assembly